MKECPHLMKYLIVAMHLIFTRRSGRDTRNTAGSFRRQGKRMLEKKDRGEEADCPCRSRRRGVKKIIDCGYKESAELEERMKYLNWKNFKNLNPRKKMYLTGTAICFLLFLISLSQVISHYANAHKADVEFAQLAEIVEQTEDSPEEESKTGETEEGQFPLERYRELFDQNNDMAGWIAIDGTQVNYPVMYTPDNPDFYLKHSFEKEYSDYGVPYIAEHCDPAEPSDNVIIYGHHMKNGSMFTDLMEYEDKAFYEKHKTIHFDTLTETAEYEVIAVFKTTVYNDTGFKYYLFAHAEKEKDFTEYVKQCKSLALYDTEVSAEYGDKLLTLSTCEYSRNNGRLVVVAKKVVEG